jgi:biofilm PGA synthesis N-glycosyltransferase PgaC
MVPVVGVFVAATVVGYVLFGYPVLLGFLARRRAKEIHRAPIHPTVSIIVAVHNGEQFIAAKLRSVLELDYPAEKMEVIIASDGSTDATERIAAEFAGQGIRLLPLPRGGKASALNAAIKQSRGEILVLTDVRQRLAPDSLRLLVENFADPSVGAASGQLVILNGATREESDVGLYWRYEVWIRRCLSDLDSIFGATGAYYAIRRELTVPIPTEIINDDMFLPLAGFFRGYRLIVDSRARMFDYPTAMDSEFQRKVRTLSGNYQLLRWYPHLLSSRNRMWAHFVSYKFGRLLLPFALLAAAVFSFGLPSPWSVVAVAAQIAFYSAAFGDRWIPDRNFAKRFTSPARTFVTLMAATLLASSILFRPTPRPWLSTEVRIAR